MGTAGAVTLAGCGVLSSNDEQSEESGLTAGVAIGWWAKEGQLLQAGYLLATQNLSSGSGPIVADGEYDQPFGELGGGLLAVRVQHRPQLVAGRRRALGDDAVCPSPNGRSGRCIRGVTSARNWRAGVQHSPGTTTMRGCGHQTIGSVSVVEELPDVRQSPGEDTKLFETIKMVEDCGGPASNCEL